MLLIYTDSRAETKTTVTGTAAFKHVAPLFTHSCTPSFLCQRLLLPP